MKPFEIARGVWWVGALHPELRLFDDLFEAANGTSYNAYLVAGFGLKLAFAGLRANFTPTADDLAGCRALGRALAGQAAEAWEKATAAR